MHRAFTCALFALCFSLCFGTAFGLGTWKATGGTCLGSCGSSGVLAGYTYVCTSSSGTALSSSQCTSPKPSSSGIGPRCTVSTPCSTVRPVPQRPTFTNSQHMEGRVELKELTHKYNTAVDNYKVKNGPNVDLPRGTILAEVIGKKVVSHFGKGLALEIAKQAFSELFLKNKEARNGRSLAADGDLADEMQQLLTAGLTESQIVGLPDQLYVPSMTRALITDPTLCANIADGWTPSDTLSLADLKGMLTSRNSMLFAWKTCNTITDRKECGILMAENYNGVVYRNLEGIAVGTLSEQPCITQTIGDPTMSKVPSSGGCISQSVSLQSGNCPNAQPPSCAATNTWTTCSNGVHASDYNQHGCADVASSSLCAFKTADAESNFVQLMKDSFKQFGVGSMCFVDLPTANSELCPVTNLVPDVLTSVKANLTIAIADARTRSSATTVTDGSTAGDSNPVPGPAVKSSASSTIASVLVNTCLAAVLFVVMKYRA